MSTPPDKRMQDREAVRSVIQQWNANRLDLFALSEPDENILFHGVMRFYFQDSGQKVATKCIRVASDATVSDVIETLIEKFRPDMRMLSVPNYALYEVHSNGEERRLNPDEKPLLVQLNWHIDDREGRFLLKNIDQKTTPIECTENNFKRKLSKREKKEQKKKEKFAKVNSDVNSNLGSITGKGVNDENHVAEKLYTELPETSFTRSISNPEAVMRRRRQQKLEKKLQQFRSRDGGPDTGGTLKIYGESICRDVPYKTLLLSIRDCAQAVVREMLSKYGLEKADPLQYCLVQVNSDNTEYILDDDECPLSILMNHPTSRGSIMFHVRRRPADSQPRRRKKKPLGVSNAANSLSSEREGPMLVEVTHSGEGGRKIKLNNDPVSVGSANTNSLQLFGPSIQSRHCLISLLDGVCTVTPLHTDALTFVNGHHITQPTILHNGSVVMLGRVASYRFVDSPQDGRYNLALSQSQLDSACLYESSRSPASPQSWNDEEGVLSPVEEKNNCGESLPQHSILKSDFDVNNITPSEHSAGGSTIINDTKARSVRGDQVPIQETEFFYDPEQETKSLSSAKSDDSNNPEVRLPKINVDETHQGQEPILPAVLEFPENHQESFLKQIITELDVNAPNFKLAPVYSLYLCARYRASTHYRPELQPTERAHKLTIFLHHVANLIYSIIEDQYTDPRILAFWMANSSEFLHFLKSDRHISAFSVQAQELLGESVQTAFRNLVDCFRVELSQTLSQFLSENIDHDSAAGLVLTVLGSAMALLRRCRVNAALTIQLFSQLFHYINVICFNTIVASSHMCTAEWGSVITQRLQLLELWAERQGLELAADCHLAKINQCAQFLQAPKTTVEEIQQLACSCFRLNSLQMAALLQQEKIPRNLIDTAIRMAESVADELTRADGREVKLEESPELHLALLLPDDGFSCDVVRGIPSGLVDFLNPLQASGMCRLAAQPTSVGMWTVYMHQFNARSPSEMSNKPPQPDVQVIKLQKNTNGMGLSIVAAKGAGQERLGIYIKSVVAGGAADADGRLQAGDQLIRVDGQSLIGITQERAADYLVRTGPVVTLEVAKQGAIYHGLATLLQQPSPIIQRGNRRMSERDINLMGSRESSKSINQAIGHPNSKSVPALHYGIASNMGISNSKSRSIHSLINNNNSNTNNNEQGFYQNLSICRAQNQSLPALGERISMVSQNTIGNLIGSQSLSNTKQQQFGTHVTSQQQFTLNRPILTNNNVSSSASMPSPNSTQSYNHPQMAPHLSLAIGNRSNSSRDLNTQKNLRMNQMITPSMPNISDYNLQQQQLQISSSQSMQNINMASQNQIGSQINQHFDNNSMHILAQHADVEMQQQYHQKAAPAVQLRDENKIIEIPGRRNNQAGLHSIDTGNPQMQTSANQHITQPIHSSPTCIQQLSPHNQIPINILKEQHLNRTKKDELAPPLPPVTTHPLLKNSPPQLYSQGGINYAASTLEPPKAVYYSGGNPNQQKNYVGANNPWQREEREKELEIRREHVRKWRDQQIIELSSVRQRNLQQEDQLKALMLERDFERRAHQEITEDQEDDLESSSHKDNVQEVIRLAQQSNVVQAPVTNFRQTDIKISTTNANQNDESITVLTAPVLTDSQQSYQTYFIKQSEINSAVQPKSILKNYQQTSIPSSPSKSQKSASFADDHRNTQTEHSISQLMKDVANVNLSNTDLLMELDIAKDYQERIEENLSTEQQTPPPPPERNSSYLVMSQQQQKIQTPTLKSNSMQSELNSASNGNNNNGIKQRKSLMNNINNNVINSQSSHSGALQAIGDNSVMPHLFVNKSDNKRVSFHGNENNFMISEQQEFNSGQMNFENLEDADRFIKDATAILESPTTPEINWNTSIKSTPGVIGAQEFYRDPRTRRLAEQQKQQQKSNDEAVPEKLSFKEKMKMFALESGEDQTPKDKLKISRAQRDIDAVH